MACIASGCWALSRHSARWGDNKYSSSIALVHAGATNPSSGRDKAPINRSGTPDGRLRTDEGRVPGFAHRCQSSAQVHEQTNHVDEPRLRPREPTVPQAFLKQTICPTPLSQNRIVSNGVTRSCCCSGLTNQRTGRMNSRVAPSLHCGYPRQRVHILGGRLQQRSLQNSVSRRGGH